MTARNAATPNVWVILDGDIVGARVRWANSSVADGDDEVEHGSHGGRTRIAVDVGRRRRSSIMETSVARSDISICGPTDRTQSGRSRSTSAWLHSSPIVCGHATAPSPIGVTVPTATDVSSAAATTTTSGPVDGHNPWRAGQCRRRSQPRGPRRYGSDGITLTSVLRHTGAPDTMYSRECRGPVGPDLERPDPSQP